MDILELLLLIEENARLINKASTLIQTLRNEGRDKLTPEEVTQLRNMDDSARKRLVDALNNS